MVVLSRHSVGEFRQLLKREAQVRLGSGHGPCYWWGFLYVRLIWSTPFPLEGQGGASPPGTRSASVFLALGDIGHLATSRIFP